MPGYVTALLVIGGLVAIYRLSARVTAQGGRSGKDATSVADQVLGEADTFRGGRAPDDPDWDGEVRLFPPTKSRGW